MGAKTLKKIKNIDIVVIEKEQEKIETVIVKKAGLGKYKQLSDIIQNLFQMLPNILEEKGIEDPDKYIESLEITELVMLIPELLGNSIDQLIELICLGADIEKKYAEEHIGADEAFEILEAIIEVNGLLKVVEKGKNFMNRLGLGGIMKNQSKKMISQSQLNNIKGIPNKEDPEETKISTN